MRVKKLIELLQDQDPDAYVRIAVSEVEDDPVGVLCSHPSELHFYVGGEVIGFDSQRPDLPNTDVVVIYASLDGRFVDTEGEPELAESVAEGAIAPD